MVFLNINYENYLYKIKMSGFIIIIIYIYYSYGKFWCYKEKYERVDLKNIIKEK